MMEQKPFLGDKSSESESKQPTVSLTPHVFLCLLMILVYTITNILSLINNNHHNNHNLTFWSTLHVLFQLHVFFLLKLKRSYVLGVWQMCTIWRLNDFLTE